MIRAAVIACVLLACHADDAAVTVRLWAMGPEGEVVGTLVADFERAHPGVHVEVQQLPWTSAHEKLLTAFVGDATPDVTALGNTWLPELAELGALAPLDAEIARSSVIAPADYFPGVWDINRLDDHVFGVPWYVDTRLVFYRTDLFAAAGFARVPTSWPDWLAALRAIKHQVGAARFAILLPVDEFEQLLALALQQDEPLIRDGRWGNFESAGFRRALTFYLQLFAEQLAPVVTDVQVSNPWDELARGYFACFLHGPWSIGELRRRLPAAQQALWSTAPLPGPNGPGASIAGGTSFVVFRRAAHPREAWQLIEYLSRPDVERRFYALTGDLPPRRSAWADPELTGDAQVAAFRDQLERVKRTPPVPEWERIATEMRTVSERAARRVSPATTPGELAAIVDDAARELDARVDQMLDKRRWILDRREAAR
ncbi:MAG TPA: sugar ABC transporter substrate-binding protein [Kofleriaceae bacterium]|nr:sugar ABC transporter substrate-binding protein [Kofleriaceae bacterium]